MRQDRAVFLEHRLKLLETNLACSDGCDLLREAREEKQRKLLLGAIGWDERRGDKF